MKRWLDPPEETTSISRRRSRTVSSDRSGFITRSKVTSYVDVNSMEGDEVTTLGAFKLVSKRCFELFAEFVLFLFAVLRSIVVSWARWLLPKHYKDISEDVVLITGGGKGIGRILALEFAAHKPKRIILWGRTEDTLRATCRAVRFRHVPCTYVVCDVTDRQQVYRKAEEIKQTIGTVTILVNNAGVVFGNDILTSDDDDIFTTFNVNAISHFWTTKAFLPDMLSHDHGHVVTISSLLGFMGFAGAGDYCASKFASTGFTETLTVEISREDVSDVHVTSVHPYVINTDMFAGISSRFDWLFPPLDKEYVAWKTVDAVLTNQPLVIMPRFFYLFLVAKSILPIETMLLFYKYLGIDSAMSTFHGRQKKA